MVVWFVALLTISLIYRVQLEPLCRMQDMKIICNSQEQNGLPKNIIAVIADDDVSDLTIVNNSIPIVNETTFSSYKNLHRLTLNNTRTSIIEEGSFETLNLLTNVSIVDNYLTEFSSNIFPSSNSTLIHLDISNNLIDDLSDFNISMFSFLTVMNISHNRLTYLPEDILHKVEEKNDFYILIDYNPWNCSHPKWIDKLNSSSMLRQAFCVDLQYDLYEFTEKLNLANLSYSQNENSTESDLPNLSDNPVAPKCNFHRCITQCIFMSLGSIWIGIIIGNVCKIKKLVCYQPTRLEDRSTQYGQLTSKPSN